MSLREGTDGTHVSSESVGGLRRETRDSAALILMALAVVLTVSFVGLTIG
ncbi:MAG TPA: hypothetical protein VFP13_01080 [Actinomycetota bacterium]|nr:hypothetical protein [Actinomycetota bacterium]